MGGCSWILEDGYTGSPHVGIDATKDVVIPTQVTLDPDVAPIAFDENDLRGLYVAQLQSNSFTRDAGAGIRLAGRGFEVKVGDNWEGTYRSYVNFKGLEVGGTLGCRVSDVEA